MSQEGLSLQQPRLYPSFASVGVSEEFIIEYDEELVRNVLITLDVVEEYSQVLVQRVPASEIGPRVVKAKLPEFTIPGKYTVITKFSNQENDRFPRIILQVLSTLEVICLRSQMKDQDKGPVLAAALAYLIQCDMAGEHDTPEKLMDDALLTVLQSVSKVPVLSLPAFLCAKYFSGHESLLHFAIRHRLDTTCQFLLSPEVGGMLKGFLDVQGFDKKTPRELAVDMSMDGIATAIEETNVHDTSSERGSPKDSPRQASKHKHKRGMKDVAGALKSKGTRMMSASKKQYIRLKKGIKTRSKSVESDDETSSKIPEITEEPATLSITEMKKQAEPYRATVDYECYSKENGSAKVKAGEIVHVVTEEESGMCVVIIRNALKSFPISCLEKVSEDVLDDYEDMEEFVEGMPSYLKVIEDDQKPNKIQYYAHTSLAEALQPEKSKSARKAEAKEDDKAEYYYVDTMRPPQPLPVPSTADYSDEDAYEDFCPPSPETISSPAYPLRHSMYTTQDANTSQLSAMTSPGPPAVPPRMSSDRATPPPFLHEGTYINQNRRSSGTPDSYSTTPLLSPVHCAPDPNTSPKITSSESLHSLSIEGPNTLPRTSSIRPQSTVEPTSPTELPNPILNRNSAYSHKESQPLFPRTITPPAHFPRTDPTSPSKPPIAPKPALKPKIAPKPVDRQ